MTNYMWDNTSDAEHMRYKCSYCDSEVAPNKAYYTLVHPASDFGQIFICPNCSQPTFFGIDDLQVPRPLLGRPIQGINQAEIQNLYQEARACTSVGAYTAAVMTCRKILMNLAVVENANVGENFLYYVNYLVNNGFVPPRGREWVDAIRRRGNEANHEIMLMNERDAKTILFFTEGLLRFNFEFPHVLENGNEE